MSAALLVVVSGPAAGGRSALALRLGTELGVPVLTRDAVRAGLVETQSGWTMLPAAEVVARSTAAWRNALEGLLGAGVTAVTEHPLRAEVGPADLAPFTARARVKVVRCQLDPATAPLPPPPEPRLRPMRTGGMIVERPLPRRRPGGATKGPSDQDLAARLGVPVLTVEAKGKGYRPPLADIVWFLRQPG